MQNTLYSNGSKRSAEKSLVSIDYAFVLNNSSVAYEVDRTSLNTIAEDTEEGETPEEFKFGSNYVPR